MRIRLIKLTKLSWKLALLYAIVFAIVLIVLNASVLYGVKFFLVQQAEQKIESISNTVEKRIIGPNNEEMTLDDQEMIDEAKNDNTINIKIADTLGTVVNDSANFNILEIPVTNYSKSIEKVEDGELHLLVKNTIVMNGDKVEAYIQVAQNMEKEYTFLKILFLLIGFADIIGIFFSLFAGYLISRRMLRPIDKITKAAKEIGLSGLSTRIEVTSVDDELSRLAKTFNEMLDSIKESFNKQGRFVADASHELRTPVSIIQGYIDIMDRWGKEDSNVLQESINAIKNETASMTLMIERLLFLARGDNGSQLLQKTWFFIDELIEELYKESKMLSSSLEFSFNKSNGQEFFADRRMIKQMLRALLDNSIKFTPLNGTIGLLFAKDEENIIFTIVDTGVGISEEEKDLIFERFYRVDKARERETGGSGLGLSIVKWIVDAHDGQIDIDSVIGKGTSVMVSLPNLPKK